MPGDGYAGEVMRRAAWWQRVSSGPLPTPSLDHPAIAAK